MITISVHSYKGGTGKTTFLLNLAGELVKRGKKVLAIDYDLRAPSFQAYFTYKGNTFISDYLLDQSSISRVLVPTNVSSSDLTLVFASMEFLKQHSKQRDELSRDDAKFLSKLYDLQQSVATEYDYLLIDTIPGFFYRSIDAMMISDGIFVISTPSTSNLKGLEELTENMYNMILEESKIFLVLNKLENQGITEERKIIEENVKQLKQMGKKKFTGFFELPYYSSLTERIHAFESEPNEDFLEEIEKICTSIIQTFEEE